MQIGCEEGVNKIRLDYTDAGGEEVSVALKADGDIGQILKQFCDEYRKPFTMEEAEEIFGNGDLIWQDFECYIGYEIFLEFLTFQRFDLENGWYLEI